MVSSVQDVVLVYAFCHESTRNLSDESLPPSVDIPPAWPRPLAPLAQPPLDVPRVRLPLLVLQAATAATAATAAATTVAADQQPDVPSNSPGQVTATTSGPSVAQASTIPANATPLVGVIDPTLLQHDVGAMWAELQEIVLNPIEHVRTFTPVVSMPTAGQGTAPVGHPHARFHSASPGSIPKPKGCAGGGKRGFHLQDEMGLGSEDGGRRYNMILSTVRELAHAARLDFSKPYRHASRGDLHNIFASARQIHPYLSVFENDWATAEILKQFMGNVRRYGKKCGYFS